ncbi:hypothetical protein INT44_009339, partial [Umbelopsis vinacea]
MRLQNLALVAVLLAATANAVPHSKRATCQTDDDCAGVTCCNLNTNLCVNDPNGTICDIAPTKTTTKATTTKATTTKATTTKTTAKATSTATCTSDDDCPGVTCCNLNTNTCVNDPNNTICDIPPTKITTTKSSTTTKSTTTKSTTTKSTTTTTKSTTTATATATGVACTTDDDCPGVTCCNLNTNRCVNDPNNTICDIPPTKTLTTTKATTTKATTTTKTTTNSASATGPSHLTAVVNADTLCFFLPPSSGGDIADSEKSAVAFCQSASDAPGAKAFPSGFITSSHFKAATGTAAYVQYTGTINPSLYGLKSSDEGGENPPCLLGQYDNHGSGSPPGSVCAGYPYYVNLVEPAESCKNSADCPTGRSAAGCQSIIPGTYSLILELDSPLTKQAGAKSVVSYAATSDKKVIWTPPTRQEYNSNATLRAALEKAVFPIGVGLDQP